MEHILNHLMTFNMLGEMLFPLPVPDDSGERTETRRVELVRIEGQGRERRKDLMRQLYERQEHFLTRILDVVEGQDTSRGADVMACARSEMLRWSSLVRAAAGISADEWYEFRREFENETGQP